MDWITLINPYCGWSSPTINFQRIVERLHLFIRKMGNAEAILWLKIVKGNLSTRLMQILKLLSQSSIFLKKKVVCTLSIVMETMFRLSVLNSS